MTIWWTKEELKDKMGLTGPGLGGVLGALTKQARKAGLSIDDIIQKKEVDGIVYYALTDEVAEVVDKAPAPEVAKGKLGFVK